MSRDPAQVAPLVLSICFFLVFGIVVTVFVLAARRRPSAPGPTGPGQGEWNAQVAGAGLLGAAAVRSTFGIMRLSQGQLSFTPVGSVTPAWSVPADLLGVRLQTWVAASSVLLRGQMGEVRCTVSREQINRYARNSFKTLREKQYAAEFVAVLQAAGARPC